MTLPLPTGPTRLAVAALVVWAVAPFTLGELIGQALEPADEPFRTTVSIGAWAMWAVVLIAIDQWVAVTECICQDLTGHKSVFSSPWLKQALFLLVPGQPGRASRRWVGPLPAWNNRSVSVCSSATPVGSN